MMTMNFSQQIMFIYSHTEPAHLTPRRSPRIQEKVGKFDIFVFELSQDMKVMGHADVLHKVSKDSTIDDITVLLRTYEDNNKFYNPSKGLFWLRKGTKQLVSLKSSDDLQACKDEYKGDIRIACPTVRTSGTVSLYLEASM